MPNTIKSMLTEKGRSIWALSPAASVYEAAQMMVEKRVGALLVMAGDKLVGMVSERDYASRFILPGKNAKDTRVADIMTSPVFYVSPEHTVDDCMRIVTDRRIRHLPVVDNGRVVGLVSIGDLVKSIVRQQDETIQHLESYITGRYPG